MRRLATGFAALALAVAASACGDSEPTKRATTTTTPDSVVLGTETLPPPAETTRRSPRPRRRAATPPKRARPRPPAPTRRRPGVVTMIGDSLAVGTRPLLPQALTDWTVHTDARNGRPIGEGVAVLGRAQVPAGSVLAFSLFTNDPPGATAALDTALRAGATKVGPGGCQVWATIARPLPAGGSEPANGILRRLDGGQVAGARVVVADWAALVRRQPSLLAPDHVHGTPAGYRARAQLYADAVRRC